MRIYAIRDRLIDYFLPPFIAHHDHAVLASISAQIGKGETNDVLAQAPHHFELWRLGEVQEDGHINANREFIADCSTLIRAEWKSAKPGEGGTDGPPGRGRASPGGVREDTRTGVGLVPTTAPGAPTTPA